MGRGVATIPDAVAVAYQSFGPDETYYEERFGDEFYDEILDDTAPDFQDWMWREWNYDAADDYKSLREWVTEVATANWPSMEEADEWLGEVHVIAKNAHAVIGVSEYGGMVSISLAPNYDRDTYWRDDSGLKAQWLKSVTPKFLTLFGEYEKMGTASNGETFYTKKEV